MMAVAVLEIVEHSRIERPSSLISVYLLASVVTDCVQIRSLFLRQHSNSISGIFTASMTAKLILLLLESQSKRKYLKPKDSGHAPYDITGIFGRSFFWWLNPLFLLGSRNVIKLDDLGPLDEALQSERLLNLMKSAWDKCEFSVGTSISHTKRRQIEAKASIVSCLPWHPS
jgi:hypothetical protein